MLTGSFLALSSVVQGKLCWLRLWPARRACHSSLLLVDEMWVGVGAKRVRELFAAARKQKRAIILVSRIRPLKIR
jgi:hypothetical protein